MADAPKPTTVKEAIAPGATRRAPPPASGSPRGGCAGVGAARRAASGATTALITGGGCGETVGAADTSGSAAVWAGGTDTTPAERFGSG